MKDKKGLKYWFGRLSENVKSFFKHPIQYTKKWIEDFKKCSTKDKVKKVLLTVLGAYVVYRLIIIAIGILLALLIIPIFVSVPPSFYQDDEDAILFEKQRQDMYNRNKQR